MPPPNGSIGSITDGSTSTAETFRQQNWRTPTTVKPSPAIRSGAQKQSDRTRRGDSELTCVSLLDAPVWRAEHIDDSVLRNAPGGAEEIVMLQYTSGTTGNPKGVLLRHKSLINVAKLTLEAVSAPDGAVCLNPLPMFHTAGCVIATLGPLWIGGTVILVDRFSPRPVLQALGRQKVSVLFYVPAVLAALLEAQRTSDSCAPKLHTIMGGASNVSPALIEAAEEVFDATVINLFGQTELSPVLTATRPEDSRADQLNTVGRPLPQVDCRIVDPVSGKVVAIGETGEICARGYQAFARYLHDPDATARTIDADGFVHTGDLGAMESRGYLTITGRIKELIIRGGENIAPAEIESQLVSHDNVVDCAAIGLPDDRLGEVVGAVVCTSRNDARLKDALIEHLRDRLAPFKIPVRWFTATELPVTPTGKVRKFELRDAIIRGDLPELRQQQQTSVPAATSCGA